MCWWCAATLNRTQFLCIFTEFPIISSMLECSLLMVSNFSPLMTVAHCSGKVHSGIVKKFDSENKRVVVQWTEDNGCLQSETLKDKDIVEVNPRASIRIERIKILKTVFPHHHTQTHRHTHTRSHTLTLTHAHTHRHTHTHAHHIHGARNNLLYIKY